MFLKVNRSYLQENKPAKLFVTAHIDVKRTSMARTLTCFLIDTSGSMQGGPLHYAKEAVKSGIDSLGTNDFVSVIAFDTKTKIVIPTTQVINKMEINNEIDRLTAGGSTRMYSALESAGSEITRVYQPGIVPQIVLLTDGAPTDKVPVDQYVSAANHFFQNGGISFSAVGTANYNEQYIIPMANAGGGFWYHISNIQGISGAFKDSVKKVTTCVVHRPVLWFNLHNGAAIEEIYMVEPFSKQIPVLYNEGLPYCTLPNLTGDVGNYMFTARVSVPAGTQEGVNILDSRLMEGNATLSDDSVSVDYTSDLTLVMDEDSPTRLIHRVTKIQTLAEEASLTGNQELTRIVQDDIKTLIESGELEGVENIEDFKDKLTRADSVTRVESVEERKEQLSEMRGYQKEID
jgi:Ca-activated chloride channel family protein